MNAASNQPPAGVDPLLTYRHAAKVLGVTERTVRTLVDRGDLAVVRFGRSVQIDPVDLRAFIERGKRGGIGGADAKFTIYGFPLDEAPPVATFPTGEEEHGGDWSRFRESSDKLVSTVSTMSGVAPDGCRRPAPAPRAGGQACSGCLALGEADE